MRDIINLGEIYEAAKIIKVKCGIRGNQSITQLVNAIKNIAPNGRTSKTNTTELTINNKTLTYKTLQNSTENIQDELQKLRNAIENNNSVATTSTIWPYGVVYLPEAAKKIKGGNSYCEKQKIKTDDYNYAYNLVFSYLNLLARAAGATYIKDMQGPQVVVSEELEIIENELQVNYPAIYQGLDLDNVWSRLYIAIVLIGLAGGESIINLLYDGYLSNYATEIMNNYFESKDSNCLCFY